MTNPPLPLVALTLDVGELDGVVLWREIFRGLSAAGVAPLAVHTDAAQPALDTLIRHVDGIILGGGRDVDPARYGGAGDDPLIDPPRPQRDEVELRILDQARQLGKPVLAICRGMQLLNVAHGGTLVGDLRRDGVGTVMHRHTEEALAQPLHHVTVQAGTTLSRWMAASGRLEVNSQHHQGICLPGNGVRVTARADDGLIEAIELAGEPVVGVQWHPEMLWASRAHALNLLRGFGSECVSRRDQPTATL